MRPETTYQNIFGRILRELRKIKGIDQFEMAKKMGINRSSWSRIESGKTVVNIQQLQKIAEIFDMEPNEIMLKTDAVANSMKQKGYTVHYDSINKVRAKSSGSKGLALISGAVLGLIVGGILFGGDDKTEDDKSKPT